MRLSRDEKEKQRQLEKLIDWEVSKQLTWAVVFLTTILGLMSILASDLLKQWIELSDFRIKVPFVIIYLVLLFGGVDLSIYRLVSSLSVCRNLVEMLPSKLQRKQLIENAVFRKLYELLVKQTCKGEFSVRKKFLWLLFIIGDALLIWALCARAFF